MNELQRVLVGNAAAAAPEQIVRGVSDELSHRRPAGSPRSLYEELWHVVFWMEISLEWIGGRPRPYPASDADGFPTVQDMERENWTELARRFLRGLKQAAKAAGNAARLETSVECPSVPGEPIRAMTVREQLENLAAHNSYHLGRMVLLRQMLGAWPPEGGGFTW
ncbi:MAG: DinB family protein [Acidobacteriota bacterium]|nr:DinB family protein [Acidobacteriota bacterium]